VILRGKIMKNSTLISILIFIVLIISYWFMYFASPTKAEVDSYFEENKCYSGDYCVYYMRRQTAMLWGQIFQIPMWWMAPNFILYTTTPFNYYHDINHHEDEFHTYTWVDTREGRFVYNAVSGEYVKEISGNIDPAKAYSVEMDKYVEKMINLQKNAVCSSNIYNCADFKSQAEAQIVMNYCMDKVGSDIHYLDGDSDGIACENLS